MTKSLLRNIPSVDRLLGSETAHSLIDKYSREQVVHEIRLVLEDLRHEVLKAEPASLQAPEITPDHILENVGKVLEKTQAPSLVKAVNATGVILHTGLGRALLSKAARKGVAQAIESYSTLAADIETGRRGHRDIHLEKLLCEVTGSEAATVVNNNAAATMLILNTLAKDKEVIISRGQLVEIGGSFRMPDVMAASGAVMKEVGTTNKTHLRDYKAAIGENTGAIMRVHHSNYRIVGFAQEPGIEELVGLAREHNIPLIDDLGSGALVDLAEFGIESEPLVRNSLAAGVDVACFSGDKLIGGPQSGVILGKKDIIADIGKNPLMRAFRIGKMTIAAMEATLKLFLAPEKLRKDHPVYTMLSLDPGNLKRRASRVLRKVKPLVSGVSLSVEDGASQVGSGSVPIETIPSKVLAVKPDDSNAEGLAKALRACSPPIFSRVHKDTVLLDFRTIQTDEDQLVAEALIHLLAERTS